MTIRYHERYYTPENVKRHPGILNVPPVVLKVGKEYKLRSLVVSRTGRIYGDSIVVLKAIEGDWVKVETPNGKIWGYANREQLINKDDYYIPVPNFAKKAA